MSLVKTVVLLVIIPYSLLAQNYFVRGRVTQKENGLPLGFANIRVAGTTTGTSANLYGQYELKLPEGEYNLIISFIGYISDTVSVNLNKDMEGVNFSLESTKLDLPEIVIHPGENPAYEIIRKAIARKKQRNEKINSYEFDAYTKGLFRTQDELNPATGGLNIPLGVDDSTELKITGIIENQSKGYFEKPDKYKEIITARKQSANLPSSINTLTGGRIIKNFYEDNIDFFGSPLPGPLSEDAVEYYYFYIQNTLAMDNTTVYQIYMEPENSVDPGFVGSVYITDQTYDLIKVDLQLNRAANTGGVLDTVNIVQQFSEFEQSVYMPVDYRLLVTANVLGLFKFGFELNSTLYNYNINPEIDDEFFGKVVIKVLPEADDKDSVYWANAQTIPNTEEEQAAYKRIDSIKNAPRTFWDDFSILSPRIKWTDNFYTSAPIAMYHFNRIEGHALDFGLFVNEAMQQRMGSSLKLTYGFADKKLKKDMYAYYLFGDYRTTELSVNVFDRLNSLFEDHDKRAEFTNTILALFSKFEYTDYYYSKGFNTKLSAEVFPTLRLSAGFLNRTDNNAYINSDFSFFGKDKTVKSNPAINEVKTNAVTAGFKVDFRDIIEDGLFRRRVSRNDSHIIFEGNITHSSRDILKSSLDFTKYEMTSYGRLKTFGSAQLDFRIFAQYNTGTLPYQMLYALPGNIDYIATSFSFRTLETNEIIAENAVALYLEHNWSDELFRLSRIPGLKSWELQLTTFLNVAYTDVNNSTKINSPTAFKTYTTPFYEAGFSIGHVLVPLEVDFAWKLNHRGQNNFRVGIKSLLFGL